MCIRDRFINKGNVVDLAVGVVIGGAFGKIVSSLVDDIVSPVSYTTLTLPTSDLGEVSVVAVSFKKKNIQKKKKKK